MLSAASSTLLPTTSCSRWDLIGQIWYMYIVVTWSMAGPSSESPRTTSLGFLSFTLLEKWFPATVLPFQIDYIWIEGLSVVGRHCKNHWFHSPPSKKCIMSKYQESVLFLTHAVWCDQHTQRPAPWERACWDGGGGRVLCLVLRPHSQAPLRQTGHHIHLGQDEWPQLCHWDVLEHAQVCGEGLRSKYWGAGRWSWIWWWICGQYNHKCC